MKQIELVTVDDAISVFNNWHQDILLILNEMISKEHKKGLEEYCLSNAYDLIQDSPFKSSHFINLPIMYNNVEIIESIIND